MNVLGFAIYDIHSHVFELGAVVNFMLNLMIILYILYYYQHADIILWSYPNYYVDTKHYIMVIKLYCEALHAVWLCLY